MPLFDQYTKPGVYVREQIEEAGIPLFGQTRIPVLIGEGQEQSTVKGVSLHRGSSSYADESAVRENLSDQITGTGRTYKLNFTPVVTGDGTGSITNNPLDIKLYANGVPVLVSSLNGTTGIITTQNLLPLDTDLRVDYYFKREDRQIVDEDLTNQVPTFASVSLLSNAIKVQPSVPGALANAINIATTEVLATTMVQGLVFSAQPTKGSATDGTKCTMTFTSGSTFDVKATALDVVVTVTNTTTLGDVLGAFSNVVADNGTDTLNILCTNPNHVDLTALALPTSTATFSQVGISDALAVSGVGTDNISVEIVRPDGSYRTVQDIVNLLNSGVFTTSGGALIATLSKSALGTTPAVAAIAANMTQGFGPNTNRIFKVASTPIVDGSNGGVVTTNPSSVVVKANGVPTQVAFVDGLNGVVTLASAVPAGTNLTITYYTNNYQDTFDVLPGDNIVDIPNVGYGAGRSDFIEGVDYVLEKDSKGAKIQWGASVSTKAGHYTAGYTAFDATNITTNLVDEKVYLQPVQGVVNGKNDTFTLQDVPTDGSGLSRATDDPSKVQVFVGPDPISAMLAGPVRVIYLHGQNKAVKLYNPPAGGNLVFASYWRNLLNDHTYTLTVANPGVLGQGSYTIKDELGNVLPVVTPGAHHVNETNFSATGIVWPNSFSDLRGVAGSTPNNETITVTFQDDDLHFVVSNAVQATNLVAQNGLRFRATNTGTGPNAVTKIVLSSSGSATPDANAVTVAGEVITIQIINGSSATRSLQEIIHLFTSQTISTPAAGRIICEPASPSVVLTATASVNASTDFTGGAAAVTTPYANRFRVTSSRTAQDSSLDGRGITGSATTPTSSNVGVGAVGQVGYLGQTFADSVTGVQFTLVDPNAALDYGYTTLPSPSYHFRPGDKIVFQANSGQLRMTSATPTVDVLGLRVRVNSTYGMEPQSTALVTTYNKAGAEPKIGDFYYLDYVVKKSASDFGLKIFSNVQDVYTLYGDPIPANKLSLAARLFTQNGGQIFGCIQVPKQLGMDLASDQEFISAIDQLAMPLPGSDQKASVIVPLSTSPVVHQYLNRHLITQASERFNGEAIAYIGFDLYATPADVRPVARAIKSDRIVAVYPGGAIMSLDINGKSSEFAVSGEFLAAAVAGMDMNPAYDVATSLTRKSLVGLDRLVQRYDDITMDMAAADGICWLIERAGALQLRHYVTTDPSSPITREPSNRKISDEVRFRLRRNLDQFIARKILTSLVNDITITVHATLKSMMEQELVENYRDLVVTRDQYDSTVIHVSLAFKPVFSLMWLDVALTVTTQI